MALELELSVIARTVRSDTVRSFVLTLTLLSLVGCCAMSEPERSCEHYAASPSPRSHWRIESQRCTLVEVEIARCSHLTFGRTADIQLVMAPVAVSEPHRAAAGAVGYRSDRTRLDRTRLEGIRLDRTPPEDIRPDTLGTKRQKAQQQEEVSAPQEEPRVLEIATTCVSYHDHFDCFTEHEADNQRANGESKHFCAPLLVMQ